MKDSTSIKCTVCESVNMKILQQFNVGISYLCNNCKSIINNSSVNTDLVYDINYYENNYNKKIEEQKLKSSKILNKLKQYTSSDDKILDYGCGTGIFLSVANDMGYKQSVGVDVSSDAIEFAKKYNNNDNAFYKLSNFNTTQKFNIITLFDSIGHIKNIEDVFNDWTKINLIKMGGIILIRTPKLNTLYLLYIKSILYIAPKRYIQSLLFMPNRYIVFNQNSIKLFLERFGYEALSIDCQSDYKSRVNFSSLKLFLKSLIRAIPKLINKNDSMLIIARKIK